jgi:hypothetical protein
MSRLILRFVTAPSLVTSALLWLVAIPASAEVVQRVSDPMLDANEPQVCVVSGHSRRFNLVCERVSQLQKNDKIGQPIDLALDPFQSAESPFSEAESDAAISLFGCDCGTCLNALRIMRSMAMNYAS